MDIFKLGKQQYQYELIRINFDCFDSIFNVNWLYHHNFSGKFNPSCLCYNPNNNWNGDLVIM